MSFKDGWNEFWTNPTYDVMRWLLVLSFFSLVFAIIELACWY